MYDVITCGSATVDAFIQTGDKLFVGRNGSVRVPFGSKIVVEDVVFAVGGGGTNTATAFARLGLKVAFLGKTGQGTNSERVIKQLQKEKVDTRFVLRGNGRTGFSVVLDAYKRDRTILTFKGSNDQMRFEDVSIRKLKTKWFYFCSMMNESYKTIERLAAYAKKHNIKVLFNPSAYLARKGMGFVTKMLLNTDILVLNKEEGNLLTGKKNVKQILQELVKKGPRIVIITDGENGVHLYDTNYYYRLKPHKIKVVETTGAGDAFGAGFLVGYIKTGKVEFALKLGLITAEEVIQHIGGKHNLPSWNSAMHILNTKETKVMRMRI